MQCSTSQCCLALKPKLAAMSYLPRCPASAVNFHSELADWMLFSWKRTVLLEPAVIALGRIDSTDMVDARHGRLGIRACVQERPEAMLQPGQ